MKDTCETIQDMLGAEDNGGGGSEEEKENEERTSKVKVNEFLTGNTALGIPEKAEKDINKDEVAQKAGKRKRIRGVQKVGNTENHQNQSEGMAGETANDNLGDREFLKAGKERKTRVILKAGRQISAARNQIFSNQMAGKPAPPPVIHTGSKSKYKFMAVKASVPELPDKLTTELQNTTQEQSCINSFTKIATQSVNEGKVTPNFPKEEIVNSDLKNNRPSPPDLTQSHKTTLTPMHDLTSGHQNKSPKINAYEVMRLATSNLTGVNKKRKAIKNKLKLKSVTKNADKTSIMNYLVKKQPETSPDLCRASSSEPVLTRFPDQHALPNDYKPQISSDRFVHTCVQLHNGSTGRCCCLESEISEPVTANVYE